MSSSALVQLTVALAAGYTCPCTCSKEPEIAATARLIVMMEPKEKAALDAQADRANVSTAEFVRRRLLGRGEPEEQAFLQTLAALKPIVRQACKTIDANLAEIRGFRETGSARTAHVASHARGELTRHELESIADRLDLSPRSAARRRPR